MVVWQVFTFKKLDIGTYENEGTRSPLFHHMYDSDKPLRWMLCPCTWGKRTK